ncbi:MAG: adenylyltransferase/cytidyltransferase family protein [Thermoguttaceae bacterium]|nr:adenylyltransferase/cytidyltransferase family protein [Thermoguttaceae bacterium]
MIKVITYGTYDLLHYGHLRLLERAKALGDYLIVGVTADDFDKIRGKINVQQSLEERVAAVQATGIADKVIIEEYEGQKIDDIRKYGIDIFTVGSDWVGVFDYLNEYCKVVYLPRTDGVSSSEIRAKNASLRLGMVGYAPFLRKFYYESKFVNAVDVTGICVPEAGVLDYLGTEIFYTTEYEKLLETVDSVYIHAHPLEHYSLCKKALMAGKHVMCESPLAMTIDECNDLLALAQQRRLIIMEATRTAYITAYARMLLLLKGGKIGKVVSVDATCTSLSSSEQIGRSKQWGSLEAWGPTTMLPVFQILGTDYISKNIFSINNGMEHNDAFTKINFTYPSATATIKVGNGVKSEGELIVSGTKGYVYIPAPWWKTEYFEIRFENQANNKRYFYQVDGEGIRYELVALANAVRNNMPDYYISRNVSLAIVSIMQDFRRNQENA